MTDPLLLLHGFTQTTASFDPLRASLIARNVASQALKLPGHQAGYGSDHLVTGDLWDGADALVAEGHQGCWIGYSMGARLALHVALGHPEAVSGLVLIGGTAGIDDAAERVARRQHDDALADQIEEIGTEAFLDEWLALDLFATLPDDPDRKARRATNSPRGLASSLRLWGTGTMGPPLWDRVGSIDAPTLVLAGELDTKFTALGQRLAHTIGPNAQFLSVPEVGHAAHIEDPETVAGIVAEWLNAVSVDG